MKLRKYAHKANCEFNPIRGLVTLLLGCTILWVVTSVTDQTSLRAEENSAEDLTQYGESRSFSPPIRKVSIIATPEGFYPEQLTVFVGERVQFFVTSTTELPSCFILKGKDIFLEAKKGSISEGEVFIKEPGSYKFYCPKGKIKGQMTALVHPEVKRKRQAREVASQEAKDSRVRIWLPEDE